MADRAGFLAFIRTAGFTTIILPDASTDIDSALSLSLEIVNTDIQTLSQILYDQAVYNLGVSNLIEYASDQPNLPAGQISFASLRVKYKVAEFVSGIISAASDEGTSTTLMTPDWAQRASIADLQYLKNPWGRTYMGIAQRLGTLWGST